MNDREVREAAVKARTNVVVTAGAGTGKTTLIVDAALDRIGAGADVRRILMLTFTEKAANEMRLRVHEALGKRRDEPARAALALLDRAQIGTIHGFCAHLLREFPVEAGVDPRFAVDEGARRRAIFEREWERWLEEELAADAPRREAWLRLLESATLKEVRGVAEMLASFAVPESALDPKAALSAGRASLRLAKEAAVESLERAALPCGRPFNNLLRQMRELGLYLKDGGAPPDLEATPSADHRGWADADFDAASQAAADARALAKDVAAMDEEGLGAALALLCDFARRFRAAYTAEGFASFDGILTLTHALLDSSPSIRARVRERFDFILVDEFQDTDPAQCEIIMKLAEGKDGKPAPGRLFIVGDPKQSIYSFRGADIVAYERVRERLLEHGAEEFVLRTSFRSHAGILDVVNGVFAQVIRKRERLQPPYEPIEPEPGRAAPEGPSVELALFDRVEEDISAEDARRAEAEHIAAWLEMHKPRRDSAILLRALTDAHVYLEALREHGVPYVVEGEKFFYGAPEVIDFINLLAAAADPNDRTALAGLLRSPLGAVDDRRLWELRAAGQLDWRSEPDDPRVARFYARLRRLHERSRTARVPELVDEIFDSTFALELAAASYPGEQAVANLQKIRQKARDLDPPDLRSFLRSMREAVRSMEEEGESPLADETLDAVRVMSIHKAKGLEFPVVFLPDLHRPPGGDEEELPVRYDWPTRTLGVRLAGKTDAGAAALAARERLRRREEGKRLPYVALTRARERLFLSGSARFSAASMLGLLAGAVPDLRRGEGAVRAGGGTIAVRRLAWIEPEPREPAPAPAEAPRDDWASLAGIWRRREAEYAAAAPRLTSPSKLRATVAPPDEDGTRAAAAEVGSICHRALETIDFRKPRVEVENAEARAILESFVKTDAFAELAGAKILARELPFLLPALRSPSSAPGRPGDGEGGPRGGTVVNGVIDVVYRLGRDVWVADYKSDREEHPEKYVEQKRAYVEAVERILGLRVAGFKLIYLRTGRTVVG